MEAIDRSIEEALEAIDRSKRGVGSIDRILAPKRGGDTLAKEEDSLLVEARGTGGNRSIDRLGGDRSKRGVGSIDGLF